MSTNESEALASSGTSGTEDRGRTTLADRVIRKVAIQAALEIRHCAGVDRTALGVKVGRASVNAAAVTDGAITGLSLTLAVEYPAPIIATTREIRSRVQQRVQTLCGLAVDHIDITVADLPYPDRKKGRVR